MRLSSSKNGPTANRRSRFFGHSKPNLSFTAPGRTLRIPVEQVHAITDQKLELSELILRAVLVRHSRLTRIGSRLTLVGSRFDINVRRLLEVLSRNRLSSKWLDHESDPEAEAFLRRPNVPLADLPTLAENTALGGQAGTSSRIENYLGFPAGLSGEELTARAALQAHKFGVRDGERWTGPYCVRREAWHVRDHTWEN